MAVFLGIGVFSGCGKKTDYLPVKLDEFKSAYSKSMENLICSVSEYSSDDVKDGEEHQATVGWGIYGDSDPAALTVTCEKGKRDIKSISVFGKESDFFRAYAFFMIAAVSPSEDGEEILKELKVDEKNVKAEYLRAERNGIVYNFNRSDTADYAMFYISCDRSK